MYALFLESGQTHQQDLLKLWLEQQRQHPITDFHYIPEMHILSHSLIENPTVTNHDLIDSLK